MKIYISKEFYKDKTKIFDNNNYGKIDIEEPLQLIFYDGKITLKVFKALYLAEKDAFFVVQNFEYFLIKMRLFRDLKFEIVELNKSYLVKEGDNLNCIFGWKEGYGYDSKLRSSVNKYIKLERRLRNNCSNEDINRGVELSFRPKVYGSIRSSLTSPKDYLSGEMPCHIIFRVLTESPKSLLEIEKYVGEDIEDTIKSMLFTGIIEKKGDNFNIVSILK